MKTPQQSYNKLGEALGITNVFLKREDLHPLHSHKGRSIPIMIKEYRKKEGIHDFVISSSGNAALAAAKTVWKHNKNNTTQPITLKIFVGKRISKNKLKILKEYVADKHISLEIVKLPKRQAFLLDKEGVAKNLRQSTDPKALVGYLDLAKELAKIPDLKAIFIPTSSGTAAEGIALGFKKLDTQIQVHIVQTTQCHPMAELFDTQFTPTEHSIAGAIVDLIAHRKNSVEEAIKKSNGFGWVVSDEEIQQAINITKKTTGISISANSAISVAGLQKAIANNWKWDGPVACIITGR
jgi:threonine dehydratase